MITGDVLRSVVVPALLGILAQQLGLQGEDVVQDAIDSPALEPVVRDHTCVLEVSAQRVAEPSVDPRLSAHLGVF
jgi:hypothetical protein